MLLDSRRVDVLLICIVAGERGRRGHALQETATSPAALSPGSSWLEAAGAVPFDLAQEASQLGLQVQDKETKEQVNGSAVQDVGVREATV